MADDNLKNLISNYSSMPIGQLGDALLSRQAGQRSKSRSRRRRAEKVNNILAVLLGGQAVFNKLANQRVKELESLNTVNKYKDAKLVKKMNMVGTALKSIDADILTSDNALELIRNNKDQAEAAYANISPFIEKHIKDNMPREYKFMSQGSGGALEREKRRIFYDQVLPFYLGKEKGKTETRAQILIREGSKYFNGDFTPEELMEKFAGFEMDEATIARERRMQERKKAIRSESSLLNVFGVAGGLFKGDAGPFKEITELEDPELYSTIEKIPLSGFFGVDAGQIFRNIRGSENYADIAASLELTGTEAGGAFQEASAILEGLLIEDVDSIQRAGRKEKNFKNNWMAAASRAREVEYANRVFFQGEAVKDTDILSEIELGKRFGTIRVQLERDNQFIENINSIEKYTSFMDRHFGVSSVEKLSEQERNIMAANIIYDVVIEPRNVEDFETGGGMTIGADIGTLKVYSNPGKKNWYNVASDTDPQGNFITIDPSRMNFMLSNMAKGIDVNGQVKFEENFTSFMDNLSEIKDYELAAQRISEEIQRAKDIGGVQFAEKMAANVRKINPNITNMFNSNFQGEQGMYDAINSDNPFVINYMPDSTMPPPVPSVGSTDNQMEDWVTSANKYSTGEGKYSNVVSNWWEGQKEKPYIRDIERYYESPGTTPFQIKQRQQAFDDALKGLGITEEEAEKYRIGQ
tara:strand:+ start:476 stop:2560 length:2085 start_codon:yes stop_codon:yes gene_type:complete